MRLYAKDGSPIKIGSTVKTTLGDKAQVLAVYQPFADISGRVLLQHEDGSRCEYFTNVIQAEWKQQ